MIWSAMEQHDSIQFVLRVFSCCVLISTPLLGARVTDVQPRYGSLGGETRITILGSGFSADQFSQNDDPNSGNKVYLVGESGSEYSCPVHRDGSTEVQVMCYSPERMTEEEYYVKVVVDGKVVKDADLCGGNPTSSKCTFKPKKDYTPTIDKMTPQSGLPGSFVNMTGRMVSDRYGSNLPSATNGKKEKMLRVYVGPQDCGLKNGDAFYHLSLVNEESNEGSLVCKSKGTSVGFFNASFIIESPYGRSKPVSDLHRVSYNDQIYLFQTYTEITSISPSSGSTAGGLTLTIYGKYFDDRAPYVAPRAFIGDTVCNVTKVVLDQYIECTVAPDPKYTGASRFEGNRGVNFEYWTSTSKSSSDVDDILTLNTSSPGYNTKWLDETHFSDVNSTMDNYVSRMTTMFTPPHDGVYEFQLRADDGAKLFVDGVAMVTSKTKWKVSSRVTLQKSKRYHLVVVHYESTNDSFVHLRAKFFNTTFTNSWTGKAVQELQVISIRSTVKQDVQVLAFNGFASRSHKNEMQTVEVKASGEFRFGLYGVFTEPLSETMDDKKITEAMNALPVFGSDDSVSVTRQSTATPSYTFKFESKRGDFPAVEALAVGSSSLKYKTTEDKKGSPGMDTVALSLDGAVSQPFTVSKIDAKKLSTVINEMFEARCPDVFAASSLAKVYESFEKSSSRFSGYLVKDTEPFCGRYALKNPRRLYRKKENEKGIMLSSYGKVCFAYKGLYQNIIAVRYSLKQASNSETVTKTTYFPYTFKADSKTESRTWYYACIDVYDLIFKKHSADSEHRLDEFWLARLNQETDIFVDSFFIGRDVTTTDPDVARRRLAPAMPNGALIKTAEVTSTTANVYTVTLSPFECGNQFPLFELANGKVSSGRTASPSTAATLSLENGGSGSVSVTRTSAASPPVTGFIDVTYKGITKSNLNVSLEAADFQKELSSLPGIGALSVEKTGDCANFDLAVTFVTLPGDLPQMSVSYNKLAGIDAVSSIATTTDGGLFYDPITGDMTSTVHDKPQVRLYINEVPVSCAGDCSYEWSNSATASVTGVSPTSGTSALSTSIVITGTGFSSVQSENNVTIGGVACSLTGATTTSLTCDVGNGPVGAHPVVVMVKGKGDAQHTGGNVVFSYTAAITGIAPTSGSLGGGITLTISGYGFKKGAVVTINSAACKVTRVQPSALECAVPAATTAGAYDVVVVQGSVTLTHSSYTYDSSLTASISSVNPPTIGVQGATITISGSSFGNTNSSVFVGTKAVKVVSWTNSAIVIETGDISPGSVDVKVETASGFALDGSGALPQLTVDLRITNVFPLHGSLQGGTRLTITGSGFGTNDSLVDVKVGETKCGVSAVTNTQIKCEIEQAGRVHHVTNKGIDPLYGVYYGFDKPLVKIERGEFVQWTWETPAFVSDINHAIVQIDSISSTKAKVGGFSSGTPTKNGGFKYQFTQTGTYYVWSGYVDAYGIKNYAGQIEVVEAASRLGEIDVRVTGKPALHNVGAALDPVDSSSCRSLTSFKSGCTATMPIGGNIKKFNFIFWQCSTPIVNSIDRHNGSVYSEITLSGEGLATLDCQNEISIGNYTCVVASSSDTQVTCKMAAVGEPELGVSYPLSVRVGNRGNALFNTASLKERSFGLVPSIDSIEPTAGSLAGGAVLTITGFAFGKSPLVTVGGSTCNIVNSSFTEITCEVPASSKQGQEDILVNAYVNGSPLPADCKTSTRVCRFSYAGLWTPSITTINPDSMAGSTTFTITGTSLGKIAAEVSVTIGGAPATVTSATDTAVEGTIQNVPVGNSNVIVKVKNYGKASGSLVVSGRAVISRINPSAGSIYGNALITVKGNGFVDGQTQVTIDGSNCTIVTTTLSSVVCRTPAHAAGSVDVNVTSKSVSYTASSYSYDTASTPTVTSVNPTAGLPGATLTITGSNLDGGKVTLDGVTCTITSSGASQIQCTLGSHPTGSVPVLVSVSNLGLSNAHVNFEYELSLNSMAPTVGGTAGGQVVILSGSGFENTSVVQICGQVCPLVDVNTTSYRCKTPAQTAQTCDVSVTANGLTKSLTGVYTYDASLTPTLTTVTPSRGGTGGGTTLTVTGSGFGSTPSSVSVTLDGVTCVASSVINTKIICVTGPHPGSVDTKVEVQVSGNGIAEEASSGVGNFSYIDVWSSPFTWGGSSAPKEGEFIIIPKGMTLLLDTDTPRLDFLLIQGGKLIFDDKDLELQANIIMITDGGLLQVGTEARPFQHKAIITLHGHHRSKELPIYGTKVLAVRNGTLDLHGIEVPLTWTRLASTANAGTNSLQLTHPVEWKVGDEIVIAATGHHHSQSENEKKKISAISSDKKTLTLDSNLDAKHLGTEETFDGTLVEFRAEVGLLSHNVIVRGNTDPQWATEVKACEKGFNTGEFATQTCFQGRFGDEIGSSQFGAMILVHAPVYDTHEAQARLSYVEVTFAGQAFRLGRYPVHFHLNGDMSTSYVRGCGIHHTFNRAVNIHGTHNTIVEKTVIYNIMGGAFFLEDGIESGNTFQYNLAVFVRDSSSLLNDDITPASFWVTNPNNTIQHNAAAGGSHFGFWYRMHKNPDGPSFTTSVCPQNTPLGVFQNNTAHSFGWFGLWIFEDYFPLKGGCGGTEVEPAVFRSLTAWNNDKGAETVNSGAIQYEDFVLVQNKLAGYEGKQVNNVPHFTDASPMISNSLIVGTTSVIPSTTQGCTKGGLVFPYGTGFRTKNVRFINFADPSCVAMRWTRISGTCSEFCGGYNYHTEQLKFVNAPNKGAYEWLFEGTIVDLDGTATGKGSGGNWTILPTTGTLPPNCEAATDYSKGIPASMCNGIKFHRFSFNEVKPESMEGRNFVFTNQYGTSSVPFKDKRISHKYGWQCSLIDGATYTFSFENSKAITNISFTGQFNTFEPSDYVNMKFHVETYPDRFSIDGGSNFINETTGSLDPSVAKNGDWSFDNSTSDVTFMVHGKKRSRRGMATYDIDRAYKFSTYKCFFPNCIPPPDPDTLPPADQRPADFRYWSNTTMWNKSADGYVTDVGGAYGIPKDYDNVRIIADEWVVVNSSSIKVGILMLEGVIEFDDVPGAVYTLIADIIVIKGGRLIIGWPNNPFDGLASITLRGNISSPIFVPGDGPIMGSKAIGVFGGLDLFGKDVGVTWTQLATTVTAGSSQIVLQEPVSWGPGDDIVIGPTSYNAWETESFKITAVAADNVTLTLNDTIKHKHVAHRETLSNGLEINVGAAVGILSRNIKIIGADYSDLYTESFGARVLVGLITNNGQTYTGYARLSNVEFYHTGQEGFTEEYDPRFSLSFVAAGTVSNVKPSRVSKCSFHNGFNTAIGVFGTAGLNVTDNVVFGSVGNGLRTSSANTRLQHNLVVLMIATASYQDRKEMFSTHWEAGIEALAASDLVMQDNLVAGSERIGYHVAMQDCTDTSDRYRANRAYSNMMGVVILPDDKLSSSTCMMMGHYIAWKNHDYGLYYQNTPSVVFTDNVLIENVNGLLPIVLGPSALAHQFADKTMDVSNSTFVGATSSFDCANDKAPNDDNYAITYKARPSWAPTGGMAGLLFPNFHQGKNNAPEKPWKGIMAYNSIGGLMRINDVTFAKYGSTACKGDFAVSTDKGNDDLQHPIESRGVTLIDVQSTNKIVYHRPNAQKINSADCIDMDCDAMKKALFKDMDGTFLGHVGSVIPHSEYEWGGDPRRGLNDGRIPKSMVERPDGTKIPYSTLAPHKGVIRNSNCTYHSTWQAYECGSELQYEMLVIESMDEDHETRRLSPVAVLGDGYMDLINGPQDHGWCSGYTCRLRLSTFMALVVTDKDYLMHFSSVTPRDMRYRLLNVGSTETIKLTVWYAQASRRDVYVDGTYVIPTNVRIDSNGRYLTSVPTGNEFEPHVSNATGTNFYSKDTGLLSVIIKGSQVIDVITKDTIIVTFGIPALTVTDFYGDNMVENMAGFLGIPLTKIRVVNVVSAASVSGRRKRQAGGIVVEIEIGDEPTTSVNGTATSSINYQSLLAHASSIVNECQVGNVSGTFNQTGSCEKVELPSENMETPTITYSTPSPVALAFNNNPVPTYEGVALQTQPTIKAVDVSGNIVTELGTKEYPWQLTASIRPGTGHPDAVLGGTVLLNASSGWFNFTDLSVSHMGSDYILDFNVTFPTVATNFTLASAPFNVTGRPLKFGVAAITSGDITKDSRFTITLNLQDNTTNDVISNITWRAHTWTAEARLVTNSTYGSLGGALTTSFDVASGQAMFPDLAISGFGVYYIQLRVVSSPDDYNMTINHPVTIRNPAHVGMVIEETYEVKVKFDVDFNTVLSSTDKQNEFEQMILTEYANIWPDVKLEIGSLTEGSIVVTFVIAGSLANVNTTAYSMCDSIYNGTSYSFSGYSLTLAPFLTINNATYYGVTCGEIKDDEEKHGIKLYIIIVIVVLTLLLALGVVALAVYICKKNKSKQVPVTPSHYGYKNTAMHHGAQYIGNNKEKVEDFLFREDTFTSMKFRPPVAHNIQVSPPPQYDEYLYSTPRGNQPAPAYTPATNGVSVKPTKAATNKPTNILVSHLTAEDSTLSNRSLQVSASPAVRRAHSPFQTCESPLPPVGSNDQGPFF